MKDQNLENRNLLKLFDTHCHLASKDYNDDKVKEIIKISKRRGVRGIINVGYDMFTNERLIEQSKSNPNFSFPAIGIHPNSDPELNDQNLEWIESKVRSEKIIAIGEIGLDYYRKFTEITKQKEFFKKQLLIARKWNLPVLLHIRNAFEDAIEILEKISLNWKGIVHCFIGSCAIAEKFLSLGFHISFSGVITFPSKTSNSEVSNLVSKIPLNKIVAETDSPYLSPVPLRGRTNFPWNIHYTICKISSLRKISVEKTANAIFENSLDLFF